LTFLDLLNDLVMNYNKTKHTAHGMTPFEVYYTKDPAVIQRAYEKSYKYRKERIFRGPTQDVDDVKPGDLVRLSNMSDPQKRKVRVGLKKSIQPPWSSELHTVEKHLHSHQELTNDRYRVSGKNKLYYRSQLQVVPDSTNNDPLERPRFHEFRGRTPATRVLRRPRVVHRVDPIPVRREPSTRKKTFNTRLGEYV
jgi:hypothetical protein